MRSVIIGALALLSLSGCAVGSGVSSVSGLSYYSVTSESANRLSPEAEESLICKIRRELVEE